MGCGSSRADDSPLVALCRERRDLIRAAADHRYALASSHASYFRSLAGVGDALHRFVREELAAAPSLPPSPVLTIPSSEGKRTGSRPSGSPAGNASGGSSSLVTLLSHSLSPEGSHSHLHFSSPSDSEAGDRSDRHSSASPPPHSAAPSPNYYYMRSSTAIPSMVYEDPYAAGYSGYGYDYGYGYPPYGVPIGSPLPARDDSYYNDRPPRADVATPPPPPPPQGSSWDLFNPFFDSYEQDLPGYYQGGRYGLRSAMSSPNSTEVREREGIPELEEETEQEPVMEVRKGKKVVDEGVGTSKAVPVPEKSKKYEAVVLEEKENNRSSPEIESKKSGSVEKESKSSSVGTKARFNGEEEAGPKRKGVSFNGKGSLVTKESNVNPLSAHSTRDVTEVVDEIKDLFKSAAGFGDDVARMLEVERLPYRSGCGMFTVINSRILDLMATPTSALSRPSFKCQQLSGASTLKNKTSYADFEKNVGMKSGNLSSTLEKLYMWEKKLYEEVKDEGKLRIMYDKRCRQLKALDDRGAESYKIDSTRASIRKLSTKISVAIKSIDAISSRMHKIRDEELQPQLIELIQGLIRMWKSVLDCHQKQFQAIVDSKIHKLKAKTSIQRNFVVKAPEELEMELLNWCSCFSDWISTQKAYIEALNGWLMKWLLQEQEVTPDGVVPFSPSRVGAPAAFIISNDWYHAIERISEVEVTKAMQNFAANVHKLRESQNEEQRQKLKTEYLSRDFAARLKSLQKDNVMDGNLDVVSTTDNGLGNHDVRMMALYSMRKRLDEEKAKHEETVKHVQGAASSSLPTGLITIFQELGNFTLDTVKAYEELRIPNEGQGT